MNIAKNPILPGFHPDPSICRVGEDFYIACSSFSYFPGIPLFHSRDLSHWEPIGYAFDRPQQLELNAEHISGGLFAPTIRYHDGLFYIIVVNTSKGQVLIVTAEDPKGDWSDIHVIDGIGEDPSLFWDADGTCWCSYNRINSGIFHRKLNLNTWKAEGEEIHLWDGAAVGAWCPEASHVYYKDGWYYLIIAEGGTEHYHAVTVARSRNVNGPYQSYRGNPILTHRHLSVMYPIANIGHADLVDTPAGDWYMVALGSRLISGYHKNMGRETFLCPVRWEHGWPIAAPDTGKVGWEYEIPSLPEYPLTGYADRDDFDLPYLSGEWNYLGTPVNRPARLENSCLCIRTLPDPMHADPAADPFFPDAGDPDSEARVREIMTQRQQNLKSHAIGFVGRRQQHISYIAQTAMTFVPTGKEAAGLILLQEGYNHLRIEMARRGSSPVIRVVRNVYTSPFGTDADLLPVTEHMKLPEGETVLGEIPYEDSQVILQLRADGRMNSFYAGTDEAHMIPVAVNVDGGFLGSETCGGFVGAYIGMFATANGEVSDYEAAFDWFSCRGMD